MSTNGNGGPKKPARSTGPRSQQQRAAQASAQARARGQFEVDLPAGGRLTLNSADEVEMWRESSKRYIEDYGLTKANDLMLLGAILSQSVAMYRAQQELGDAKKAQSAVNTIGKASEQIRELEKALGIDKKTREAGGQHTVVDYVTRLKLAAHSKGVRISERTKSFEAFVMELRWKLRLLENGDDEDKRYHHISEHSILEWCKKEVVRLENEEKKWAAEKGAVFAGRL